MSTRLIITLGKCPQINQLKIVPNRRRIRDLLKRPDWWPHRSQRSSFVTIWELMTYLLSLCKLLASRWSLDWSRRSEVLKDFKMAYLNWRHVEIRFFCLRLKTISKDDPWNKVIEIVSATCLAKNIIKMAAPQNTRFYRISEASTIKFKHWQCWDHFRIYFGTRSEKQYRIALSSTKELNTCCVTLDVLSFDIKVRLTLTFKTVVSKANFPKKKTLKFLVLKGSPHTKGRSSLFRILSIFIKLMSGTI